MTDILNRLKRILAVVGFLTAGLGVALEDRRAVWVAIALLGLAFCMRLLLRARHRGDDATGE